MGIGLVSHVEDNLVLWGIIDLVQTHYQLHGTKARTEMSGIHRAAVYHIGAQLRAKFPEFLKAQSFDVLWAVYFVQESVSHCKRAYFFSTLGFSSPYPFLLSSALSQREKRKASTPKMEKMIIGTR